MDAFALIGEQSRVVINGDGVRSPDVGADDAVRDPMEVGDDRREAERLPRVELQGMHATVAYKT